MRANDDSNKAGAMRDTPFFGDVCLLGLGVTGRAVVDYFLAHPDCLNSLTIYSGKAQKENLVFLKSLPDSVITHEGTQKVSGTYDLAVVSPGIPPLSNFYLSAAKAAKEIISEPELAWRISPQNWIGVTGTNGKTTVTELIASLLESAGKTAWAAGNIGTPCIEVVSKRKQGDWLVAELSSYQLHSTIQLAPDVAVLLNITPDHLNWHGSHENYRTDKQRLLANLKPGAPTIIDVCLPETQAIADDLALRGRRVIRIGSKDGLFIDNKNHFADIAYVDEASQELTLELQTSKHTLLMADELTIRGPHNLSNALIAASVAAELGVSSDDINAGLTGFAPLPHRFEPCGEVADVYYINDSKATNSDAAIKALSTFTDDAQAGTVIALFGGMDKGTDLDELVSACKIPCRYAICYGMAGKRFFYAMDGNVTAVQAVNFDDAFSRACELAQPGDTVLLSPACASFDEFDSFEARGDCFKSKVRQLAAGTP